MLNKPIASDFKPTSEKPAPERKLSKDEAHDIVVEVRNAMQEAWEYDRDNRQEAATDLAFLSNNQWPQSVRRQRELEQRPMLTINRLPQFVRQVTNDIRQSDIAIKVVPEDDRSDPALAKIFDGLIRQIQYQSSAKHVFATAAEHQAACGIGWFRITSTYADDMAFDQEIRIERIRNPLTVFYDPAAILPDRSDARWIAVTEMMPRKAFSQKYPKAAHTDVDRPRDTNDRPFFWTMTDGVRIAEYWRKVPVEREIAQLPDGSVVDISTWDQGVRNMMLAPGARVRRVKSHKVEQYIVSGSEVLEGPHEWAGKYIPLVPVVGGEFPLEDKTYRYSVIRYARDPQQLYNYARTSMAESMALAPKAPYLVTPAMIGNYKAIWDTANKTNRPYLPYDPDPQAPGASPKREHPPEVPAAMIQESQIAAEEMKATTGIFDAGLGARSNETSGVAIGRRQAESDVANYHFVDNLEYSLTHAGRILIDLIPKIYDNERVLRILGDQPGQEEFVKINQVVYSMDGQEHVINDLSAGAFDVRVTLGRSYATRRQEAADKIEAFLRTMPPPQAALIVDLLAKNLDFPESDEIARRLRATIPPNIALDPNDPSDQQKLAQLQQEQQQPPPDPKVLAEQAKLEMAGQKAQMDMAQAQANMEIEQRRAEIEMARAQNDLEVQRQKGELEIALMREKVALEREKISAKDAAEDRAEGPESDDGVEND